MTALHERIAAAIASRRDVALAASCTVADLRVNPAAMVRLCTADLALLADHSIAYRSTSEETWEINACCSTCRTAYPCNVVRNRAVAYGIQIAD